jgi:hypothetical protein
MSNAPRAASNRASLNNFVGIFGRQAPISSLVIPRWVTIYVDLIEEQTAMGVKDFVLELVEGCAVVGATGVTVAFRIDAAKWHEYVGDDYQDVLTKAVGVSRPYFRAVVCNHFALEHHPENAAGALLVVTDGHAPEELPTVLQGQAAVCLDIETALIAKTSRPRELVRDALEQVAEMDVRRLPHWEDHLSEVLLNSTTCLLALNMLCKPERFGDDTFFFAYDYLDETVTQAFNDRTLRARWRKKGKDQQTQTESQDAAE